MSVLIELYDNETICNSIAVLSLHFDHVVFLCDNHDKGGKVMALADYVRNRTPGIDVAIQYSDTLDYENLCGMLDQFDGRDPYFEMTGGQGALLIAVTRYCLQHDAHCFFINLPEKKFVNVNRSQELADKFTFPHYSIQEAIMTAGAIFDGNNHAPIDVHDQVATADIHNLFEIAKSDFDGWVSLTSCLASAIAQRYRSQPAGLSLEIEQQVLRRMDDQQAGLLRRVTATGAVSSRQDGDRTILAFRNGLVMSLFRISGNILEYATFLALYESGIFTDVKMSVVIDYDFKDTSAQRSCCEIDVIAIQSVIPAFISCKIGSVHESDLYEIKLNTMKIAGTYAAAVLVTAYDMRRDNPVLYHKADELGITVIDRQDLIANRTAAIVADRLATAAI